MDEAQEILLCSLQSSGISLHSNISSAKGLTTEALVSICSQFLLLIDDSFSSFPTSLPSSMVDRFKICEDLASAIKALGFRETLSFHQFLYPSDEDSYKLLRFLVLKLSELSKGREGGDNDANKFHLAHKDSSGDIVEATSNQQNQQANEIGESRWDQASQSEMTSYEKEKSRCLEVVESHSEESPNHKEVLCFDGVNDSEMEEKFVAEPEEKLDSLQIQLSKLRDTKDNLQSEEKMLIEEKHVKALEIQKLEHEYEILKEAVDMAFDDEHSTGYFASRLDKQVELKRHNIRELELQWNCPNLMPEDEKTTFGLSSDNLISGVQEKLEQLKEIEQKTDKTLSEMNRRELEYSELLTELRKLPKLPPRKSYIQRITEITKNSWKQDADIDRILKETRELQLESNSIRERLDRTYMVVDETVFREAKKDAMGRQVYRLLTSMHDSFEQISEKILATDRARREAAEQQAKLTSLSSRSIDIHKLQSDLDSLRKENELLEQQLRRD